MNKVVSMRVSVKRVWQGRCIWGLSSKMHKTRAYMKDRHASEAACEQA